MEGLINNILDKMTDVAKPQKKFLVILFMTILLLRGKVNFRNLSRYSALSEKTYARQFRQSFAFADFNERLITESVPPRHEKIGAMDSSYLPKSGRKTYGIGFFYDSSHDRPAQGLEISNLAVIDVTDNTGYTLSSWQTPPQAEIEKLMAARTTPEKQAKEEVSRIDFYAEHLRRDAVHLPAEVRCLAVDGYYAKFKFITAVRALDLHAISKLRHDANLRYLYEGEQKPRGAKRKYADKIKFDDLSRFEYAGEVDKDIHLYTLVVNSVKLKCNIRLVYVLNLRNKDKPGYALLFSTDTDMDAATVYRYYKARFQIAFIFRDAKQFTGLSHCQAREQDCLDFHFNAAFSALNLAKVDAYRSFGYNLATPFSMATQKMVYFNEHLLAKVFSILELDPSLINCNPDLATLRTYGAIAPVAGPKIQCSV